MEYSLGTHNSVSVDGVEVFLDSMRLSGSEELTRASMGKFRVQSGPILQKQFFFKMTALQVIGSCVIIGETISQRFEAVIKRLSVGNAYGMCVFFS